MNKVSVCCEKDVTKVCLDNYINRKENSNIYHTLEWCKILSNTYDYKLYYLVAVKDRHICGILPLIVTQSIFWKKKIISLPYSHTVPVLYDDIESYIALLKEAEKIASCLDVEYILLKCNLDIERQRWRQHRSYYISVLDLKNDFSVIEGNIKNSTLRNIKKAKRENVLVEYVDDLGSYNDFFELVVDTRKRQGAPPYSFEFLRHLYNYLSSDQRQLYLAYKDEELLSGLIILFHGNKAIYSYGASLADKNKLRYRPNELLFWTAIKDAWKNNYHYFDFGCTPCYNTNLLHFKSKWGVNTWKVPYAFFLNSSKQKLPVTDRNSYSYLLASNVIKHLPRPLLKIIGPKILKYFGF